jgi:hypothetical protein
MILIFFVFFIFENFGKPGSLWSEAVFLKSGKILQGEIIRDTDDYVIVKFKGRKNQKIFRKEILRILFGDFYEKKVFVYKSDGSMVEAYKVNEDQESYTFRVKLQERTEFNIAKNDIQFISKSRVKPKIIKKASLMTFREKEATAYAFLETKSDRERSDRLFRVGLFFGSALVIPGLELYFGAPKQAVIATSAVFGTLGLINLIFTTREEDVYQSMIGTGVKPLDALSNLASSEKIKRRIYSATLMTAGLYSLAFPFILEKYGNDVKDINSVKGTFLSLGLFFTPIGLYYFLNPSVPERMLEKLREGVAGLAFISPYFAYYPENRSVAAGLYLQYIF